MTVDKQSEYAVYRGDDLIVIGTAKECAAEMGVIPKDGHPGSGNGR